MLYILRCMLAFAIVHSLITTPASAEGVREMQYAEFGDMQPDNGLINIQFTQKGFADDAQIRVKMWGRDRNRDGVLHSMSGLLSSVLPGPMALGPANEVIRVEVVFINFFGIPRFKQVFDARETPIQQLPVPDPTMFFGFAYNLDSGMIGDDPNEGISFAPLAPSVAYTMGEVFQQILGEGRPEFFSCGQEGTVCAGVTQLNRLDEPPGFMFVNESYTNEPIKVRRPGLPLPAREE